MIEKKVLVIVGPTASGKSALAIKLAKKFRGEIISADSRQVYKGLDIGTGKVTRKEMGKIPHYMLDVADPKKQFSASDYATEARKALVMIYHNKKLPIIVGGTGFYIDTLLGNTSLPDVPPNKKLRKELGRKSTEALFKILKKKDPARARSIDRNNKVRLIRALEIIESLGRVPLGQHRVLTRNIVYVGLMSGNLNERIYERLIERLPKIILEVKKLHKQGLSWKRMNELGLEYRYVSKYVNKEMTKQEMIEKLYSEIRKYAKRQMTWFKRNKEIRWFTPSGVEGFKLEDYKHIEKYVKKML